MITVHKVCIKLVYIKYKKYPNIHRYPKTCIILYKLVSSAVLCNIVYGVLKWYWLSVNSTLRILPNLRHDAWIKSYGVRVNIEEKAHWRIIEGPTQTGTCMYRWLTPPIQQPLRKLQTPASTTTTFRNAPTYHGIPRESVIPRLILNIQIDSCGTVVSFH